MNLPFFPLKENINLNLIFMPWNHHATQAQANQPNQNPVNLEPNVQANVQEQNLNLDQHPVGKKKNPLNKVWNQVWNFQA